MKRLVPALSQMVMVLMLLAGCGGGGSSTPAGGTTTDTTAPSTPAGLVAAASSSSSITLNWTASTDNTGVTGYKIYRNGTQISTSTTNAFSDSGLTASTSYAYTVAAYDAAGNSSAQSTSAAATTLAAGVADTTAPTVPANLTATAISTTQINLAWSASTDAVGVAGYEVWRGATKITTVTTTSYSDTGLTASTAYTYTVKAFDGAANVSAASNSATATTQAGATIFSISGQVTLNASGLAGVTVALTGATSASASTDASGNYSFSGLTNGSYTVTPSKSGYTVTPANKTVTVNNANVTGQDFTATATSAGSSWSLLKLPDTGQTTHYSTVFGDDASYSINLPSFADNSNGTVNDNLTGLRWQKQDDGSTRTWIDAVTYCDGLALAGNENWRLPNVNELMSIFNYGSTGSSAYFTNTKLSEYWTANTSKYDTDYSWSVHGYYGYLTRSISKNGSAYVRCVSGGQQVLRSFSDSGNGSITDNNTSLAWQKQDDGTQRIWEDAITYCEGLTLAGQSDWRLPNIKELITIVDDSDRYSPTINITYFPSTQTFEYWSSTSSWWAGLAWSVDFYDGVSNANGGWDRNGNQTTSAKSSAKYVRCVRGGQ